MITNEKCKLNCELAFRSIGYRSVQADPDVPFDRASSTVPQNIGNIFYVLFEFQNCLKLIVLS